MQASDFDAIVEAHREGGAGRALELLVERLLQAGDLHRVFEARTLLARHELGLPLRAPAGSEMDPALRDALEERLVEACRDVGRSFLDAGDVVAGFQYLQMIGEIEPVRAKIDALGSPSAEELSPIIEIAVSRGVHPLRGIELILENYGLCQAITACESLLAQGAAPEARSASIRRLVRAVHRELTERIRHEARQREPTAGTDATLLELIEGRDWLFENENYHVDTSHLNAIVRMARMLEPCEELDLAIELCEYGRKLSIRYRYPDPPPFEDVYVASERFFEVLQGRGVEAGLEFFRQKAESADPREVGVYPSEVYLHLLRQSGRTQEALEFAVRRPSEIAGPLASSINDLCEQVGQFEIMARLARERNDPLTYVVALLRGAGSP